MTETVHEAVTHAVVSHGGDFFGEDRHPIRLLASLAGYAEGCLAYAERGTLMQLLTRPSDGTLPPAVAADLAQLLHRLARHGFVKAGAAAVARSLGDAAARAAADGEPWVWRIETGTQTSTTQ